MTTSEAAEEAAAPAPRRFVLPQFLSSQECKELEFIHKSCGVFGYRPFVLSTTMSHLVATNCAHLIIPLLSVRERVKEAVEQYFGREYELFVEFTGLISWTTGGNIGWHSDDNRSYLRQRHYSAVCYLNNHEEDFKGGVFHFQEGKPLSVIPSLGTLVIYTADERNMHRVDEVREGERCTLALWFTSDRVYDEDQKLIQQIFTTVPDLQARRSDDEFGKVLDKSPPKQRAHRPIAASSAMYRAYNLQNEPDQLMEGSTIGESANPYFNTTNDLRVVRLALMGLSCRFSSATEDDQHENPVVLTYMQREVPHLFSSSLEALQVAMFHQLKKAIIKDKSSSFGGLWLVDSQWKSKIFDHADSSHSQIKAGDCSTQTRDNVLKQEVESLGDPNQVLVSPLNADHEEWDDFLDSVQKFEAYTSTLWRELFQVFPSWRTSGYLCPLL